MKKIIVFGISIFLLITSGVIVLTQKKSNVIKSPIKSDKTYRIAILLPLSHPALEEIQQGFIETLSKAINISYDIYNGNGDRVLMRSQTEQIMQKEYNLICALSTSAALVCKEISIQRKNTTPVVCCGVSENPVEIGLVKSLETSENNFVVVSDHHDFEKQLKVLLTLRPVKKIVLPYYPAPGLEKQIEELAKISKKLGIELRTIKIYALNELFVKTNALLTSDDVIIVLKDNVIVSGIESLITLAQRKNTTLYVSDLNSVDKGAVIGFGVQEYAIGAIGAQKALSILHDYKQPSELSSTLVTDFTVKINLKELQKQNLALNETLLFLMQSTLCVEGK